ncbi:MAG: transposase [Desulfobacterales bacterium]|nr:transposase [Desulfobacterales bacterium]
MKNSLMPAKPTKRATTGGCPYQEPPKRKSIRLKGYDYSQAGLYFITICTQNRLCLFGEIKNREMVLNNAGMMIKITWNEIPIYYHEFNIHEFVVMPNHVHGIIQIIPNPKSNPNPVGAGPRACLGIDEQPTNGQPQGDGQPQGVAPTMSISDVVHRFKTLTTKRYTDGVKNNDWQKFNKKLWQRNYYEHIIRNERSNCQISEYIQSNPLKWQDDTYYAENHRI